MRQLTRPSLTSRTKRFLATRTADVAASATPKDRAAQLWARRSNKAFEEVRRALRSMAPGLERCVYCEDSQGTAIDHFRPKATYPLHAFEWENYFLACSHCNSNEKREQFPLDANGAALLVDPVVDDPAQHLDFSPATGKFVPRTPNGVASAQVFGLNRELLARGRVDAWNAMQALLIRYDALLMRRCRKKAAAVKQALGNHPFSSVLLRLLDLSRGPGSRLVDPDCLAVLRRRPEVATWV